MRSPYVCLADEIQKSWWVRGRCGMYRAGNDFTIPFLMANISSLKAAVVWKVYVCNLSPWEVVETSRGRVWEGVMSRGRVGGNYVPGVSDRAPVGILPQACPQSGHDRVFPASGLTVCPPHTQGCCCRDVTFHFTRTEQKLLLSRTVSWTSLFSLYIAQLWHFVIATERELTIQIPSLS